MQRRRLMASITAGALILAAGAVAAGANMGLAGIADNPSPVGKLAPVAAAEDAAATSPTTSIEPTVVTEYLDEPGAAPAAEPAPTRSTPRSTVAPDANRSQANATPAADTPAPAPTITRHQDERDEHSNDASDDHHDHGDDD
ncbi:MAG: hypothetical protein ACOYNI_07710 [Acidimicrobiia bacterium]